MYENPYLWEINNYSKTIFFLKKPIFFIFGGQEDKKCCLNAKKKNRLHFLRK